MLKLLKIIFKNLILTYLTFIKWQYASRGLKTGENIMIKPALKGCITSANLSNIFFCSFIWMGISLDFEILFSIYCGEKVGILHPWPYQHR